MTIAEQNHDPLVGALARLAVPAPTSFGDRIVARWVEVDGPVGALYVAFTELGVAYVRPAATVAGAGEFAESFRNHFGRPLRAATHPLAGLLPALRSGRSRTLRFDLRGLTDFERAVLLKAQQIPAGQTRPYGWVASEIGNPGAVRAVGSALGRNPVPVLIPCHRVVRSDGRPGQYVFGSALKESLLRAENVNLDEVRALAAERVFFVGSDTTGVVCFPTCAHARRITTPHRRGFRNLRQAVESGYRPCRHCRPAVPESA